jgi:membrane protein implicated in regulation of membrane protease activity
MITVPVEDFVFVVCALLGGALLLITVVFDDIIGGVLDALHVGVEIGGTSLAPLLIAFVAMFGVGGLFATQLLDVHGGQAALVGLVSGLGGVAIVYALFTVFRRSEGKSPFSLRDLVGRTASVAVGIPAGAYGTVYISAEGQTHEFTATATTAIAPGTPVTITAVAGSGLVVIPAASPPAQPSLEGGSPRA